MKLREPKNAILHEDIKHRHTLLELLRERAYRHGQFTLSSGKESEHYVNCKPVTLSCEGNALLSHLMIKEVEKNAVAVGGLTLGADPLVCGIAQKAYYKGNRHIDALIIRKNPKGYGTKEVIEGNKPKKGAVVTVLEDVTTTGGSAMTAVNALLPVVVTSSNTVTTLPFAGLLPSMTSLVPYPLGFLRMMSASMCLLPL